MYEYDKIWCELQSRTLKVFAERKDTEPVFTLDLSTATKIMRDNAESPNSITVHASLCGYSIARSCEQAWCVLVAPRSILVLCAEQ